MVEQAIGLGLAISLIFSETLGLAAGGMVVPGYLALMIHEPLRLLGTMLVGLATFGALKLLSRYVLVFGRRRIVLAVFSLALYEFSERSLTPVHAEAYRKKQEAVRLMQRAEAMIAAAKRERGIAIDARNDPDGYGVIGPQFTLITTDRGAQAAKVLAAHPNFAAAVTQMMLEGGVQQGDLVAVGVTGSLPGFNLAVLAACTAIGAEPLVITS